MRGPPPPLLFDKMKAQDIIERAAELGIEIDAAQAERLTEQITAYVEEECGCIPEALAPFMPDMALYRHMQSEAGAGTVTSIKEGDSSVTYDPQGGALSSLSAGFDLLARFRTVKW